MNILRGVYPQDRNEYYVCLNTVKVAGKPKDAAHYLSRFASDKAANFQCERERPFIPIIAMADFYAQPKGNIKMEQLYVLKSLDDMYFVAASYDGNVEFTSNIDDAAHYLSDHAAHEAATMLESFDLEFSVEVHGFWSEE